MKKIIALLLILATLFSLAACSNPADNGDGLSTPESSESVPESSSGSAPDRIELPYTVPMSETVKYAIEKAWEEETGEELVWFDENAEKLDYEATRYYGYFSDYLIIFKHVGWNIEYDCVLEVAGQRFIHRQMFEIYAYKNGSFYDIKSAYESEKLSFPDVSIIADIHAEFEAYIKMYSEE